MNNYKPKYWNDIGKYQKDYDRLYKKLIPSIGEAETKLGELLRSISRFYYDRYNNGHCNDTSKFQTYINTFGLKRVRVFEGMTDKELDIIVDKIIVYIKKRLD